MGRERRWVCNLTERLRRWVCNLMERREEEEDDGNWLKVIPHDLIIEILSRLPAKSLLRFRCVSKLCSSITSRPDFIKTFAARSSPRTGILFTAKKRGFVSLPRHEEASCDVYTIPENHPIFGYVIMGTESVQGLMCFLYRNGFIVWNPTLRQHVALPNPVPRVTRICGSFGYDPIEDKYKVLCNPSWEFQEDMMLLLVLTLGPQESWRLIQSSSVHFTTQRGRIGTCINGRVYYPGTIPSKPVHGIYLEQEHILVSFDVRYETFSTIREPADDKLCDDCMLNYEGKLAWVCSSLSRLRFWVLEDEEKQEWSLREFLLPFPADPKWGINLWLLDITHDTGEFVYMEVESKTIYFWYYDPKRNLTRRIKYEGVGDEALGMGDDFEDLSWTMVQYYPNLTESLMSLDNLLLGNVPSCYHDFDDFISGYDYASDEYI